MNPLFAPAADRTATLQTWLDAELLGRARPATTPRPEGWVALSGTVEMPEGGPVLRHAAEGARQFLGQMRPEPGGAPVRLALESGIKQDGFQWEATEAALEIRASNERGLANALHYLAWELAAHGGPWLPPGTLERTPTLATRLTEGVFTPTEQTPENPGILSDAYLQLMARFGATGLKTKISIFHYWRSTTLPELNAPEVEARIAGLRAHAQRLAEHGLELFLIINAPPLPPDHPVFAAHPEVVGARDEVFMEELSGRDRRVLCASQPKVQAAYREVLSALFGDLPEAAGGIILIGGEGFRHCFMRPAGAEPTNCPHCRGRDAHERVATLVNTIHTGIRAAGRGQRLLAWPYSAFVWSRDDATESRWISHLAPGVEVLSNFDCGDPDPTHPEGGHLFDYNLRMRGPSTRYAAQAAACRKQGLPMLAKTETNTTPDTFFLPYLPLPFRWHERFAAIRDSGAAGFMGQWRFYGMNGSLPEELQYHSVWNPERSAETVLADIARRDFGLPPEATAQAVEAWREMDAAWSAFPYSAMTSGETEAYMRGPWYLGPAHPLVFNEQSDYQLPPAFFQRRGDLGEMLSKDAIGRLAGKPRYVCNLLFCLPFGVEAYLRLARSCRDGWDAGLARFEAALGSTPTPRAVLERNVCRTISIHLHTLVNTAEFFHARERLASGPVDLPAFQSLLAEMDAILTREIANARRALPILEDDPRIGYGYTYNEVYDTAMVEAKIRQCTFVKENELPRIGSVIRFHVWLRYP